MSLKVGSVVPLTDTAENEILTYTAAAGDFIRAWYVWGEADCLLAIKIDGTLKDIGIIEVPTGDNKDDYYKPIPPIALSAGEVVKIYAQKLADAASKDFRAVLY